MIFASNQAAAGGGSTMIIMMVGLVAIMYFLMIRPQRKEQKKMQEMLSAMEVGDAVMTTGGFYGIVIDISDEDVIVEFGNNKNCRIPMKREAIASVEKPGQAMVVNEKPARKGKAKAEEVKKETEATAEEAKDEAK